MKYNVTSFSRLAGVSRQTVYNRLSKDLAPFVTVEGGYKLIDDAALSLFSSPVPDAALPESLTGEELSKSVNCQDEDLTVLQAQITALQEEIEGLREDKAHLQAEIADLMQQNKMLLELLASAQRVALPEPKPERKPFLQRLFGR